MRRIQTADCDVACVFLFVLKNRPLDTGKIIFHRRRNQRMTAKKKVKIRTENDETGPEAAPITADDAAKEEVSRQESDSENKDMEETGDPSEKTVSRIETLEQEVKETYDRLLRVSAEFENYKKRAAREMSDFRKYANESIVRAMLPVIDNLGRAIESSGNDGEISSPLVEGVDMTLKEILKIFEQFGVKPFESVGETFDPAFHQAVMQEETEDHPDNIVLTELQKGYMMHDRLLRPAMVIVSKRKETGGSNDKEEG